MATSKVPAFKAALLAKLVALQATTLVGVQVSYGWPSNVQPELIWLADVPDAEQVPAAMRAGGYSIEESFVAEVKVRVEKQGTKQQTATERAYAISAEIETAIRSDVKVSNTVRVARFESGPLEEGVTPDDSARIAIVTCRIHCDVRI